MPNKDIDTHLESLAAYLPKLAQKAVVDYTPIVNNIVNNQSQDAQYIEHTLDGLLGFCFDPAALVLFKKLCHHYHSIDPTSAASHVNAYREMWDSEPKMKR